MTDLNEKINELSETADTTSEFDQNDIQQNKAMGILAYLSWLVLIPLFAAKESKFARFHCNQGLVLAIAEIAIWVVCGILSRIPFIGWLFVVIEGLLGVVFLVLSILGIINAAKGQAKELPIIGKFRILK